jgi:hypothetical protein
MVRLTKNAGSVTVSGPTLICPCSIKVTASLSVSAIFNRTSTTGNRRRAKAEAGICSAFAKEVWVSIKPSLYSLSSKALVEFIRVVLSGVNCLSLATNEVI